MTYYILILVRCSIKKKHTATAVKRVKDHGIDGKAVSRVRAGLKSYRKEVQFNGKIYNRGL